MYWLGQGQMIGNWESFEELLCRPNTKLGIWEQKPPMDRQATAYIQKLSSLRCGANCVTLPNATGALRYQWPQTAVHYRRLNRFFTKLTERLQTDRVQRCVTSTNREPSQRESQSLSKRAKVKPSPWLRLRSLGATPHTWYFSLLILSLSILYI